VTGANALIRGYAKSVVGPSHLAAELKWLVYGVIKPERVL
jgi:hypothetical protein